MSVPVYTYTCMCYIYISMLAWWIVINLFFSIFVHLFLSVFLPALKKLLLSRSSRWLRWIYIKLCLSKTQDMISTDKDGLKFLNFSSLQIGLICSLISFSVYQLIRGCIVGILTSVGQILVSKKKKKNKADVEISLLTGVLETLSPFSVSSISLQKKNKK